MRCRMALARWAMLIVLLLAAATTSVLTALASNPNTSGDYNSPCSVQGQSYAAPSAGSTSYSWTYTWCTYSPWGAYDHAYFWDGGWWDIAVSDPTFAYYGRTLYSAAVEGWHQNFFPYSPYARTAYTYAP